MEQVLGGDEPGVPPLARGVHLLLERAPEHLGDLGAAHSAHGGQERAEVQALEERAARGVLRPRLRQLQDLLLCGTIGQGHLHEAVETSRGDERGIHRVRPVRRGDDDHGREVIEAIHLLAERRHQAGAGLPRLGRREQVLQGQRGGLIQEDHGLPLGLGDPHDLLQDLARGRAELGREVHQLEVVEDRPGARRQRAREHGLAGAGRTVEEQALGRGDAPLAVELRVGERRGEAAHGRLGLGEAADVLEGGLRLDDDHDPPAQVTELLPELREDVLDAALDRPLLAAVLRRLGDGVLHLLGRHGQILGGAPAGGGWRRSDFSNTRSSTKTGAFARMASAMASDGRESSCMSPPPATRYTVA